jgi:hypothetical protein
VNDAKSLPVEGGENDKRKRKKGQNEKRDITDIDKMGKA